jgi:hypothetical protein
MKKSVLTTGLSLLFGLMVSEQVLAADFIFNPTVTFEVIDGGFSGNPDGLGDEVFPGNFDTVVLGSTGEAAEFAEFNISGFSIPASESITNATFQATGLPNEVFGLGATGQRPSSLVARGYVGNGLVDASDFQAGAILDSVNVSPNFVQETYNFDATAFIQNLVSNKDFFAGFGIRAQNTIGGLLLDRGTNSFNSPRLIIKTAPITTTIPEPSTTLGFLAFSALGMGSLLKRKHHQI